MCNQSLQRRAVTIYIPKISSDIDQLAAKLGGNCQAIDALNGGIEQSFIFNQESYAVQFYNAVLHFPELMAIEISL
jgi:hypothetical protein